MNSKVLGIGIILIVLIAAFVVYGYVRSPRADTEETATTTPALNTGDRTNYRSVKLGVSFTYDPAMYGVAEEGNRAYIYDLTTPPLQGQHIERLEKLPNESLEQAIERQVLDDTENADCTVQVTQSALGKAAYQQAQISYPPPTDPDQPFWTSAALCNESYAKTNGIRFFLYDPTHADRFYFLDIGQYPITAFGTTTWQETLEIE